MVKAGSKYVLARHSSFQSFINHGPLRPRFRGLTLHLVLSWILTTWLFLQDPPVLGKLAFKCWWCKKDYDSWMTCEIFLSWMNRLRIRYLSGQCTLPRVFSLFKKLIRLNGRYETKYPFQGWSRVHGWLNMLLKAKIRRKGKV